MHSHALVSRVAAWWEARRRPATPWVSPETYPFDADRVPGESYRDYLFRKGVGSYAA